jgi:hypothetical protein
MMIPITPKPNRRKPYKIEKRSDLTAAPPFNSEGLRVLVQEALGPKYAPIGEAETVELCGILNFWHHHFYAAQEERKFNDSADRVRTELESVAPLISNILEALSRENEIFHGQDQFTIWKLKQGHDLAKHLRPEGLGFLQRKDLPDHARNWTWVAEVLPADISKAMLPTNPKYRGGHTPGGPLAKILSAVVPRITGEEVPASAVSSQLKKQDILRKKNISK